MATTLSNQQNAAQGQPAGTEKGAQDASNNAVSILKKITKEKYPIFLAKLKQNITDPKFINAIKQVHASGAQIEPTRIAPEVFNLRPTQNEIDITKSLKFPLTSPETMASYLSGQTVSPGGADIVTSSGGKYIVDGHHRWSQVYVINPKAKITALDLTDVNNPMDALKAAQLGIVSVTNQLPSASVSAGSGNLLAIDQNALVNYVAKTITPEVLQTMQQAGVISKPDGQEAGNYIWKNVEAMQKNNTPVSGAPTRDLMPQTDDAGALNTAKNAPNPEEPPLSEMLRRIKELAGLK